MWLVVNSKLDRVGARLFPLETKSSQPQESFSGKFILAVEDGDVVTVAELSQAELSWATPYLIQAFTLSKTNASCLERISFAAATHSMKL